MDGPGLRSEGFDHVRSVTNLAACAVYLHVASGTAYQARGLRRVVQVVVLVPGVAGVFLGYRFPPLLLTRFST